MAASYGVLAGLKKVASRGGLAFLLALMLAVPVQASPMRLLVLGDSLSAGYGLPHAEAFEAQLAAALHRQGYEVQIIDGAVSGDTTAGGRARLDWLLADGADAAIVELGANDGLRGLPPDDMERNLTAILDRLRRSHTPVLLSGMLAPPNLGSEYAAAFHAVFTRLGERPDVIFDPFFLEGVAAQPELNQPDRLHPNAEGVRRIVARLLPAMERLIAMVKE